MSEKYIFQIETSHLCDLRCPECAIGGGVADRRKAFMTYEEYKIVASKIQNYASYIFLHIWGEPLLNPDIFKIIRLTSSFSRCHISTNGMCMTDTMAEDLILSGVSDVLVSIDGMTDEIYSKYRVGGDVNKAISALKMLHSYNLKHGQRVRIVPQFIVFKHNQHEMEMFRNLCRELGLLPTFKAPYIRNVLEFQVADDPQYTRPRYSDISQLKVAMTGCKSFMNGCFILVDGSVVACCSDYNGETLFGNIFKQELAEIRNSDEFKKFENKIKSGDIPKFCLDNCMSWSLESKYMTYIGSNNDSVINKMMKKICSMFK